MKPRRALAMTHCPNCGARIVPTPKEFKQWRKAAGLTQRQMAARLKITAAHVAYLEHGKRSPIEFRIIYLQRKEVGLLPEGHDQGWSAAHAAQRAAGMEA